jgi:hypothetical protein
VAKYFDIPLQHASGRLLKLMRRGSSREHFLRLLAKLRGAMPNVALRSSFIVGFPGETDEDFRALLDFVATAQFDHLGVFLYSNEETSGSFALPEQVPAALARRRQRQLMALQRRISRRKLRQKVGQTFPLLVEGRSEETELLFRGRLETQAPGIDGRVLINDFEGAEPQPGQFRWATLTAAGDYDLVARLEAARVEGDGPSTLACLGGQAQDGEASTLRCLPQRSRRERPANRARPAPPKREPLGPAGKGAQQGAGLVRIQPVTPSGDGSGDRRTSPQLRQL